MLLRIHVSCAITTHNTNGVQHLQTVHAANVLRKFAAKRIEAQIELHQLSQPRDGARNATIKHVVVQPPAYKKKKREKN